MFNTISSSDTATFRLCVCIMLSPSKSPFIPFYLNSPLSTCSVRQKWGFRTGQSFLCLSSRSINYRQHRQGEKYIRGEAMLIYPETHLLADIHPQPNMRFSLSTIALLAFVAGASAIALPEANVEATQCLASSTSCLKNTDCCSQQCGRFLPTIFYNVSCLY